MAFKFEIIANALVVTDTISTVIQLNTPRRNAWTDTRDLIRDADISIYDTDGVNASSSAIFNCSLSEAVNKDLVAFDQDTFLLFVQANLGQPAKGGTDPVDTAIGLHPGRSLLGIFSSQDDVGVTFQHLWNGGGNLVYPLVAETWEVVSTSADDTIAGTGAQKITIFTLDIDKAEQTPVQVDMNGTTPVVISGTHFRKNNFLMTQSGTVGTEGLTAGDITLRVSGGGLTRGIIKAGQTSDTSSHYTVPLGKYIVWGQAFNDSPKGEDVNFRARIQVAGEGVFNLSGTSTIYESGLVFKFVAVFPLPPKSEILFEAASTNIGTFGVGAMEFTVLDADQFISTQSVRV